MHEVKSAKMAICQNDKKEKGIEMEREGKRWDVVRGGFKGRSTSEALEDFRKSTIYKDIEQFMCVNLEVFRDMLEMDPEDRNEGYTVKRSDSHVRGMIELAKRMTFLLDDMVEIVLQQIQEEKEDADEDESEEGND